MHVESGTAVRARLFYIAQVSVLLIKQEKLHTHTYKRTQSLM